MFCFSIATFTQEINNSLSDLNNELKVYEVLLKNHILYIDTMNYYSSYNTDSVIYIYAINGVTNYLPDSLVGRKIEVLNYDQLLASHIGKSLIFTEIRPMYIENGLICFSYSIMTFDDEMLVSSGDGSYFKLQFNCTLNKFELFEENHTPHDTIVR